MTKPDFRYLAGLMDGEGTFSIQFKMKPSRRSGMRPWFCPRMSMTLKYGPQVLEELREAFGGSITYGKREQVRWALSGREKLRYAAESLAPYLRIKKGIAAEFLHALDLAPNLKGVARNTGKTAWTDDAMMEMMHLAHTLNPHASRKNRQPILCCA